MKTFFLSILLALSVTSGGALASSESEQSISQETEQLEGQLRASEETIQSLVQELRFTKGSQQFEKSDCDGESRPRPTRPTTCIPRCDLRGSQGQCLTWGSDYCGVSPSCTSYCSLRGSRGQCLSWGPDICH